MPDNAAGLILVLRKLFPVEVGQEGFGPWGNDCHDEMRRWCYFVGRASDCVGMFGVAQCGWVGAVIVRLSFPYYGWLEQPFQEGVGGGTTSRFVPMRARTFAA